MTKVFVNGTFDILHPGHIRLLRSASSIGKVCVAIDSDNRVKQLKGPYRPINNAYHRIQMLEALKYVDYAMVFHSDEELKQIITEWKPDYMIKGSDYRGKLIVGEELVLRILFIDITDDSTTKIIERISNR